MQIRGDRQRAIRPYPGGARDPSPAAPVQHGRPGRGEELVHKALAGGAVSQCPSGSAADDETPGEAIFLGPYRSAGMLGTCIEALGRILPLETVLGFSGRTVHVSTVRWAAARRVSGWTRMSIAGRWSSGIATLLRGEGGEDHLRALVAERERLAGELEFEAAARLRDLISGHRAHPAGSGGSRLGKRRWTSGRDLTLHRARCHRGVRPLRRDGWWRIGASRTATARASRTSRLRGARR